MSSGFSAISRRINQMLRGLGRRRIARGDPRSGACFAVTPPTRGLLAKLARLGHTCRTLTPRRSLCAEQAQRNTRDVIPTRYAARAPKGRAFVRQHAGNAGAGNDRTLAKYDISIACLCEPNLEHLRPACFLPMPTFSSRQPKARLPNSVKGIARTSGRTSPGWGMALNLGGFRRESCPLHCRPLR